jgi:hypothetical protein
VPFAETVPLIDSVLAPMNTNPAPAPPLPPA